MTKLSEKIVAKIELDRIAPIPKWHFLLKEGVIWTIAVIAVVVGALAVAVSLHLLTVPLDTLPAVSVREELWSKLATIPYLWVGIMGLFLFVAYHNFHHTEGGYRWKTFHLAVLTALVSVVLGMILLGTGLVPSINGYFVRNVPGYTQYGDMRGMIWMRPQEGRLAGRIRAINARTNTMTLIDLRNKTWEITYTPETLVRTDLSRGEQVKVLGKQTGFNTFDAYEFRPWEGQGMMQGNRRMMRITR